MNEKKKWLEENDEAIKAYNEQLNNRKTFAEQMGKFKNEK